MKNPTHRLEKKEKKIVEVEYIDSNILNEQSDHVIKPETIQAIGYLVEETDEYITIARELIDDEYRGQVSISKVAVKLQEKKMKYVIEVRSGRRWIETVAVFDSEEEARKWGRWNYREDEGLSKEGFNWRIVKLQEKK